ncbi:hypothetical protein GCM10008022_02380 [Paenibacillus hunanensis]|nr:hypothetical protein GCM10008022_02380 [Paenibacillus hunanensis]
MDKGSVTTKEYGTKMLYIIITPKSLLHKKQKAFHSSVTDSRHLYGQLYRTGELYNLEHG